MTRSVYELPIDSSGCLLRVVDDIYGRRCRVGGYQQQASAAGPQRTQKVRHSVVTAGGQRRPRAHGRRTRAALPCRQDMSHVTGQGDGRVVTREGEGADLPLTRPARATRWGAGSLDDVLFRLIVMSGDGYSCC